MTNDFYDIHGNLVCFEPVDRIEIQHYDNAANKAFLLETDWYVTRNQETGKAIPQEILIQRQEARDAIEQPIHD